MTHVSSPRPQTNLLHNSGFSRSSADNLRPTTRRRRRPDRRAGNVAQPTSASTPPSTTTASGTPAAARLSTGSPRCSSTGTATGSGAGPSTPDFEHARRAIGEVAVPFGVCAEPSNVQAGGSLPVPVPLRRLRPLPTDVSYLPDLQAYLDDLLRNRERLLATADLDDWARTEAIPSDEEISPIRRLIARFGVGLDELTPEERQRMEKAVTVVRRHRTVTLGMPRLRQALPDLRPERTA